MTETKQAGSIVKAHADFGAGATAVQAPWACNNSLATAILGHGKLAAMRLLIL